MTLKRAVLDLRTHLGLDLPELAKILGISKQAVWYWEGGKTTPRPTHLSALIGLANQSGAPREIAEAFEEALGTDEVRA